MIIDVAVGGCWWWWWEGCTCSLKPCGQKKRGRGEKESVLVCHTRSSCLLSYLSHTLLLICSSCLSASVSMRTESTGGCWWVVVVRVTCPKCVRVCLCVFLAPIVLSFSCLSWQRDAAGCARKHVCGITVAIRKP